MALALIVAALASLSLSSCGTDQNNQQARPARATESSADRYHAALARFTAYEKASEPIFAKGKATPQARAVLGRYWQTTGPQTVPATYQKVADAKLRQMDANNIQIKGLPRVLWSKPTQVIDTRVGIEQCVDHRRQQLVQDGRAAPPNTAGPITRRIELVRSSPGQPWMLSAVDDGDGNRPCSRH